MGPLKVVFMGTPEFAIAPLEALLKPNPDFPIEIVGVYTQPDRPVGRGLQVSESAVKKLALAHGLPVFQPEKLSLPGEFDRLKALAPDVIVVVAFGQILKRDVLDLPRLGCVNIHSSLLPKWRGAAPIHWAMLGGDSETGVTTMKLVEKLDAGDILLQDKTPISSRETVGELHDRLAQMGGRLIVPTLKGLADGSLKGTVQDEAQVTYAKKLTKEMELLDPALGAAELDRRVRALNPWPGTSIWLNLGDAAAQRLKVKEAALRSEIRGNEGKLFEQAGMICLGTREGALELKRLQWDGKKEVGPNDFLSGLKGRGIKLPLALRPRLGV